MKKPLVELKDCEAYPMCSKSKNWKKNGCICGGYSGTIYPRMTEKYTKRLLEKH